MQFICGSILVKTTLEAMLAMARGWGGLALGVSIDLPQESID
jgi:hypothetical protein